MFLRFSELCEGWYLLAGSGAVELPTVVATPDGLTVESSFGKRFPEMTRYNQSSLRISTD
jgi:hypothetical protein